MTKDTHIALSSEMLEAVALQFRALSEASRLRIMNILFGGEHTVGELADESGLSQANVSKHLSILFAAGFVTRRKEDVRVIYAIADDRTYALCDLMCGRVRERIARDHAILAPPPAEKKTAATKKK